MELAQKFRNLLGSIQAKNNKEKCMSVYLYNYSKEQMFDCLLGATTWQNNWRTNFKLNNGKCFVQVSAPTQGIFYIGTTKPKLEQEKKKQFLKG